MASATPSVSGPSIDPLRLRRALGTFVTGVTVVTACEPDGNPRGFTANSFTSVSLDPPLVLVCIAKTSASCQIFCQVAAFAVNILADSQRVVSACFASRKADRFGETAWHRAASGVPLIEGAVSWFDCMRHEVIDAGDHVILIGRVTSFADSAASPLAYARGDFLDLEMDQRALEATNRRGSIAVGALLDRMGQILLQRQGEHWSLPLAPAQDRFGAARTAFDGLLEGRGLKAGLTFLYSVFDAPGGAGAQIIFRGMLEDCVLPEDMALFPVKELPLERVPLRPMRSLLKRYRREHESARFGLFVEAPGQIGHVAMIDGELAAWASQDRSAETQT